MIDKDGGTVAGKFKEFLALYHDVKEVPDDRDMIQEEMFNRNLDYVAVIPENFEEACLGQQGPVETIRLPDSNKAFYADQQINTFLNDMRVMTDSGFSAGEAADEILRISGEKVQVTMLDQDGHGGQKPPICLHVSVYALYHAGGALLLYELCSDRIPQKKKSAAECSVQRSVSAARICR